MNYWLVKQEPETYPWSQLVSDRRTAWTGVRNYAARNFLRAMAKGDSVLYYHSGGEKAVVGIAEVDKAPYPDPTAEDEKSQWTAVDIRPVRPLKAHVTLAALKADAALRELKLLRQSRLSVSPLTAPEYARILELSQASGD